MTTKPNNTYSITDQTKETLKNFNRRTVLEGNIKTENQFHLTKITLRCNEHEHIYGINWSIQVFLSLITKTCLYKYIEVSPPKNENFQIKNSDIFHISAQNIDCGHLFTIYVLSRNEKNNVYPYQPQFYYIKWGLRESKLYKYVFVMYPNIFLKIRMSAIIPKEQ